jgi:ABC-type transport system involved in Fe-S cluster assembly fused permease/ATPase subunit
MQNLDDSVPKEWPHEGKIKFEGVSLRYDPSRDPVVSKLDLEIPAGQKVKVFYLNRYHLCKFVVSQLFLAWDLWPHRKWKVVFGNVTVWNGGHF